RTADSRYGRGVINAVDEETTLHPGTTQVDTAVVTRPGTPVVETVVGKTCTLYHVFCTQLNPGGAIAFVDRSGGHELGQTFVCIDLKEHSHIINTNTMSAVGDAQGRKVRSNCPVKNVGIEDG